MRKSIKLFLFTVLITVPLVLSCGRPDESENQTEERRQSVQVMEVKTTSEDVVKTYTGSLEGERQAYIYAKLSESVENIAVEVGQKVNADDILISLDKTGPSTRYNETRSIFENSEKNYYKMEKLYEQGAISESEFDAAKTNYEVARANFESVSRMVDIRSTIDGIVTAIDVSSGDYVNVGTKLATVASTGKLRVKFDVNTEDVKTFKEGTELTVHSDVFDISAPGKVIKVASSADPMTRSFQVEGLIDNSEGLLKPGMFVRIKYLAEKMDNIILIPRKAVMLLDGEHTVFIVQNDRAVERKVKLGPEVNGHVVVESGLNAGDTLVTMGQDYLEDSLGVNITSWEH